METPVKFETDSLRLKYEGGNWQLWAGANLLKDFGRSQMEAQQALDVFRDLRVNSHGAIGGVFEYWLSDGEAPSAMLRSRNVLDFKPERLRVELIGGNWCLRDDRIVLYSFGPSKSEAEAALAVCKRYGFNELGYVGQPTPVMKYLMYDKGVEARNAMSGKTGGPIVPVSAPMKAQELARRPLTIPGEGTIGTWQKIDYRRLDLRKNRGEWQLNAEQTKLGDFGPFDREASVFLQALQQFRCTEICTVGSSGFGFFLSGGRAPQGTLVGLASRTIRPESLHVQQTGNTWTICEDRMPLFDLGANADDAKHALAALKYFKFNHVCQVGGHHLSGLKLFVKTP